MAAKYKLCLARTPVELGLLPRSMRYKRDYCRFKKGHPYGHQDFYLRTWSRGKRK